MNRFGGVVPTVERRCRNPDDAGSNPVTAFGDVALLVRALLWYCRGSSSILDVAFFMPEWLELVYAADLKFADLRVVWVRIPPPVLEER